MTSEQKKATIDALRDLIASKKGENKNQSSQKPNDSKLNKPTPKSDADDKLDKAKKALDDAKKDLEKQEKEKQESGEPLDTPEERKEKEDIARRVEQIKRAFGDIREKEKAEREAKAARQKEKQDKVKAASDRMRVNPLNKFKINLNNFIANQLEEIEDETYTKLNPSYEGGEFIIPGTKYVENKRIPVINVYHDTSGSFTSHPEKQKMVDRVIATLQKYERDGDIKVNRYYHADKVAETREEAGHSNNGDNVIKHIQDTKPDNVIITTDSDLSDTSLSAVVPGAVWMLFFDARSPGLVNNLHGRKETKIYDIDY